MEQEKIKILHYIKHLESGGGEYLLYNLYKNMDREKIQFDFLVNSRKKEKLDDAMIKLGGRIVTLLDHEPKIIPVKIALAKKKLKQLLQSGEYQQFHIHCSNAQGLLYAEVAKSVGVPVRIVHSHNASFDGSFRLFKLAFHNFWKKKYMQSPTDYIACSRLAAEWLYSKDIVKNERYILLKNGIETSKYSFSAEKREEIRSMLRLESKKILINIGRMEYQKNQIFLINVFAKICEISDEYRMIVIGKGSLEKKIKRSAQKLHVEDKIVFVDYTDKVEYYLFASDLFILPSLYEGLGIVAVEAQAAGLTTIVSDAVPEEANVSDLICSLPVSLGAEEWAGYILSAKINDDRVRYGDIVRQAGYDIQSSARELQEFYIRRDMEIHPL